MTDLEALTRIIWGEAEAEIFSGKLGVGASIVNQAQEERKNVLQIIQSPGQFEAYANRRFWQAPYNSRKPALIEAKNAAARVLQGQDPVYRKTHFCAYQKNPCRWHYSQTPPVQYLGHHLYVRSRAYR